MRKEYRRERRTSSFNVDMKWRRLYRPVNSSVIAERSVRSSCERSTMMGLASSGRTLDR